MKYFCEACERLVPPASFRMEDGLLVVKCSRCKVEMRSVPEQVEDPAPAAPSKPAKSKASKASKSSEPVIMLGESEAEPDPIENEPTRRVAVPAEILAAIENEARESRRKTKESEPAKTPVPVADEPAKTPVPAPAPVVVKPQVPEPVVTKFQAPEPVAAKAPPPEPVASKPRLAMSETAAASNLMVLRLSEVQSRGGGETTVVPPAPEPVPAKASGVQLRVVQDPSAPAAPVSSFSSSSDDPFMPPAGYCPKCIGVKKDGAVVCPYCGLDYARFRPEESRPSGAVASTWLGVVELWESKGAHDKVLALASERGELAALGRLYRIRLARNPEDTMAQRGREEVLRLAAASSTFMATPPPDKSTKMRMAGLGLVFLLLMIAAVAIGAQVKRMLTTGSP
ncbi:hypothetical protein ATI61_107263 [Archangium gephyra]|uniref:DNA polymerase III subunits gamma and tau n=1 Tax=Archangium gephyra TaxID=48 RepID=A0AAC8TJE3_9BACT|nr:DNA polymerase III subunits gamma and tau [Archangium gephyra]REG29567.1 hypothetical protein ATI61_107263 [Archangium gephyra]